MDLLTVLFWLGNVVLTIILGITANRLDRWSTTWWATNLSKRIAKHEAELILVTKLYDDTKELYLRFIFNLLAGLFFFGTGVILLITYAAFRVALTSPVATGAGFYLFIISLGFGFIGVTTFANEARIINNVRNFEQYKDSQQDLINKLKMKLSSSTTVQP